MVQEAPIILLLTPRMMAASTIQFTGDQARRFAGVSPEAWRHWRKAVVYLAAKHGKAARFSVGEIVALSVIAESVGRLGIGVGRLSMGWDELFRLCAVQRPSALRGLVAVVTADGATLVGTDTHAVQTGPAVVVPCEPIVERLLTAAFLENVAREQPSLPFPPRVVAGQPR